jgi:acetyl esterase/lipase
MADIKNWMTLAKPDPEWQQTVNEKMGGQAPDLGVFPSIQALREWITNAKLATAALMGAGNIKGVKETDHQVTMRDGAKITCRVYQPETPPKDGSPLFVVYHGGGW